MSPDKLRPRSDNLQDKTFWKADGPSDIAKGNYDYYDDKGRQETFGTTNRSLENPRVSFKDRQEEPFRTPDRSSDNTVKDWDDEHRRYIPRTAGLSSDNLRTRYEDQKEKHFWTNDGSSDNQGARYEARQKKPFETADESSDNLWDEAGRDEFNQMYNRSSVNTKRECEYERVKGRDGCERDALGITNRSSDTPREACRQHSQIIQRTIQKSGFAIPVSDGGQQAKMPTNASPAASPDQRACQSPDQRARQSLDQRARQSPDQRACQGPMNARPNRDDKKKMADDPDVEKRVGELVTEFGDIFDNGKTLKPMHCNLIMIEFCEDAVSFAMCYPRSIPHAVLPKVKAEINDMIERGIIEKVTKPTEWCAPIITPLQPNGRVRMCQVCQDFRKVNKFVKWHWYPTKTAWMQTLFHFRRDLLCSFPTYPDIVNPIVVSISVLLNGLKLALLNIQATLDPKTWKVMDGARELLKLMRYSPSFHGYLNVFSSNFEGDENDHDDGFRFTNTESSDFNRTLIARWMDLSGCEIESSLEAIFQNTWKIKRMEMDGATGEDEEEIDNALDSVLDEFRQAADRRPDKSCEQNDFIERYLKLRSKFSSVNSLKAGESLASLHLPILGYCLSSLLVANAHWPNFNIYCDSDVNELRDVEPILDEVKVVSNEHLETWPENPDLESIGVINRILWLTVLKPIPEFRIRFERLLDRVEVWNKNVNKNGLIYNVEICRSINHWLDLEIAQYLQANHGSMMAYKMLNNTFLGFTAHGLFQIVALAQCQTGLWKNTLSLIESLLRRQSQYNLIEMRRWIDCIALKTVLLCFALQQVILTLRLSSNHGVPKSVLKPIEMLYKTSSEAYLEAKNALPESSESSIDVVLRLISLESIKIAINNVKYQLKIDLDCFFRWLAEEEKIAMDNEEETAKLVKANTKKFAVQCIVSTQEFCKAALLMAKAKDPKITDEFSIMVLAMIRLRVKAVSQKWDSLNKSLDFIGDDSSILYLKHDFGPEQEESEGPSGDSKLDGMGLGEGSGKNNVSDQITSEDQLESLQDDKNQQGNDEKDEQDNEKKEEEDGIEMSTNFDAEMHDKKEDQEEEKVEERENWTKPKTQGIVANSVSATAYFKCVSLDTEQHCFEGPQACCQLGHHRCWIYPYLILGVPTGYVLVIRCDGLPEQFIDVIELCYSEKAETSRDQPEDDEAAAEEECLLGGGPECERGEDPSDKVDELLYPAEEDEKMETDDVLAEGREKNSNVPAKAGEDRRNQIQSCKLGTSAGMEPSLQERREPPAANDTLGPVGDLEPNPEMNERRPPRDDDCRFPIDQVVPDGLHQRAIRRGFLALSVRRIKQLKHDQDGENPRLSAAVKRSVWKYEKRRHREAKSRRS